MTSLTHIDELRAFSVRSYRLGDEDAILRLFHRVFGQRSREMWEWEYGRCPDGRQIMVAEEAGGRIIAHYATLPLRANVRGRIDQIGLGVDSMVDPDWQNGLSRKSPFLQTARAYFRTWGADRNYCGFGFPNGAARRIGAKLLDYTALFAPIVTLYHNFFEPVLRIDSPRGLECCEVERFGPEVDELWQRCAPEFPLAVVRDARYLNWRYADCPAPYRLFELRRNGRTDAVFVVRADWCGVPILIVADFIARRDDAAALQCCLAAALAHAARAQQARVEMWLPVHHPFFGFARAAGFRAEPSQHRFYVRLYRSPGELEWHRRNWYYTIGDSDIF